MPIARSTLALLGLAFSIGTAAADTRRPAAAPRAVVELFTSQGCSSCPAADALFETYANRSDVVALSYSVDYWDNLGWKDTLASPKFTQRQRAYAKARGDGQIYTPQLVVNGSVHMSGAKATAVDRAVAGAAETSAARWVAMSVSVRDGHLSVEVPAMVAGGRPIKDATLWLAMFKRKVEVSVKKGENAGKTLVYHNVVRDLTPIGMWDGQAMTVRLAQQALGNGDVEACAVLLQEGHAGPILGAAILQRW